MRSSLIASILLASLLGCVSARAASGPPKRTHKQGEAPVEERSSRDVIARKPPKEAPAGWTVRSTGSTTVRTGGYHGTTLAGALKVAKALSPQVLVFTELAYAQNYPAIEASGSVVGNPVLGAVYIHPVDSDLLAVVAAAAAIPVGEGGGDAPNPNTLRAARSAQLLGGPAFATNYASSVLAGQLTYWPGYVGAELKMAVVTQLRTRGAKMDADAVNVIGATSLQLGVSPIDPTLRASSSNEAIFFAEARYNRFLSTPTFVTLNESARDYVFFGGGIQMRVNLGETMALRPLARYVRAVDLPLAQVEYGVVEVEIGLSW